MKKRTFPLSLIFGIALCVFQSCAPPKPIPIDLPQAPQRLCIASQIIPGELMIISVTKSFSALVNTDTNSANTFSNFIVEHARVLLKINGTTYKLPKFAPGFYGNIMAPNAAGTLFELEVYDSTTGLSATSSARYMPFVSIDSTWFDKQVITIDNKPQDTIYYANIRYQDLPGESFFMVNCYRNFNFFSSGNITKSLFGTGSSEINTPVADVGFENNKITTRVRLLGYNAGDTCTMTVTNVDPLYYTYLVERNRSTRNVLGTILGEPVTYTTNVNSGYGFFTAHIPNIRIQIVPK